MKTGAQARVLKAVSRGCQFADEIAKESKTSQIQVYTHLRRLIDAGLIKSYKCQHKTGRKGYQIATVEVLLLDIWK